MATRANDTLIDVQSPTSLKPLLPDMFAFDDKGVPFALLGSVCIGCERLFFPARQRCIRCADASSLTCIVLPSEGLIHASTVSHVRSAVGHEPPYAYGYVSLADDRLRIFAPFDGKDPIWFQPGRPVRIAFGSIPAAGLPPTLGYSFIPAMGACDA